MSATTAGPAGSAPDPAGSMVRLVKGANRDLIGSIVRRLAAAGFGIRETHTRVFENLDADGTRLTTLADRAGMTHQAMGELVGELSQLGYLERVPDPQDGRARLIRATPTGRDLHAAGMAHLRDVRDRWERALDGITVDQVLGALAALSEVCVADPVETEDRR